MTATISAERSALEDRSASAATVTVEWGDDLHSLTLIPRNWKRVKAGKALSLRGKGYRYEGEWFWDYWTFAVDGSLMVEDSGDGVGFIGTVSDAVVTEHAYTPTVRPNSSRLSSIRPSKWSSRS